MSGQPTGCACDPDVNYWCDVHGKEKVDYQRQAAFEKFRNSVGFQIMFVLHSGLEVPRAVDHICSAAERLITALPLGESNAVSVIVSATKEGK